jgi:hypothetical protein
VERAVHGLGVGVSEFARDGAGDGVRGFLVPVDDLGQHTVRMIESLALVAGHGVVHDVGSLS